METCRVNGCNKKVENEGLCSKHYTRFLKYGDRILKNDLAKYTCKVEGCNEKHYAKGYCSQHYSRFKRYGDPLITRHSPKCIVSACDSKATKAGYCSPHYDKYALGIDKDTSIFKGDE